MSNVTPKPVKTLLPLLIALLAVFGLAIPTFADQRAAAPCGDTSGFEVVPLSSLPPEATETANLIEQGGPFPYPEDGTVFQNREGILPDCESGYYHEYTVETPGSPDRGARRIVTGAEGEHFYTDDHYASFVLIDLDGGAEPPACGEASLDEVPVGELPAEVADTIALVAAGGPYPYEQDGTVYENREGLLPSCAAGYYHLYTVPTPDAPDRGERRLITGEAGELYYTPDSYASFVEVITG